MKKKIYMAYFYPNDGRPSKEVINEDDIREYMGEVMNDFGPLEFNGNKVLTHLNGQYICIGILKGVI